MRNLWLFLFSIFVLSISTSAQDKGASFKGYAMPSAATRVTSMAGNQGGSVSLTEGGEVPVEAEYSCDKLPTRTYKGNVGISLGHEPPRPYSDFRKLQEMKTAALKKEYADKGATIEEVEGTSVMYIVTKKPCIEGYNPTMKVLDFIARWSNDTTAVDFQASGVKPETAKRYWLEVLGKIKKLDYNSIKSGMSVPPEEPPEE